MLNYTEEIVSAESEDGIVHAGAVIRPTDGPVRPLAVVWVHGLTGRFYETHALRIGRAMAGAGYAFVTGNNRGHDVGTWVRPKVGEQRLAGGAWEMFSESPMDLAGWINYAVGLGFDRVMLVGHSLGALKVAFYQAQRQDPRVAGLVGASPPVRASQIDPELLARVQAMVAEGRGQDLIHVGSPPRIFSAQTYLSRSQTSLDVYGFRLPDAPVSRIRCPVFALYGTEEPGVGGAAELEQIRHNATSAPRVDTALIPGADHSYAGHEIEVAALFVTWADSLASPSP